MDDAPKERRHKHADKPKHKHRGKSRHSEQEKENEAREGKRKDSRKHRHKDESRDRDAGKVGGSSGRGSASPITLDVPEVGAAVEADVLAELVSSQVPLCFCTCAGKSVAPECIADLGCAVPLARRRIADWSHLDPENCCLSVHRRIHMCCHDCIMQWRWCWEMNPQSLDTSTVAGLLK